MESENRDPLGREIRKIIKVDGARKVIGKRMRESLDRSPQGTAMVKADMSELIAFKNELSTKGQPVSLTSLFVKIASLALEEHPIFNSSLQDKNIIIYKPANIGVAVFVNESLFVPVIENTQDKDIYDISNEIKTIIRKLEKQQFDEIVLSGSTFTVNNMGMFEIDGFTPFLNPPEAGILGIGKTRKEVTVDEDDSIVIKPMTTLSLTNDHAVVDGVPVGRFLGSVKKMMGTPTEYLL